MISKTERNSFLQNKKSLNNTFDSGHFKTMNSKINFSERMLKKNDPLERLTNIYKKTEEIKKISESVKKIKEKFKQEKVILEEKLVKIQNNEKKINTEDSKKILLINPWNVPLNMLYDNITTDNFKIKQNLG